MILCQSCGMPIETDDLMGLNEDGSLNAEYCTYCYNKGKFTNNFTMDQMIMHCLSFIDQVNVGSKKSISREDALLKMKEYFPKLKRWKVEE